MSRDCIWYLTCHGRSAGYVGQLNNNNNNGYFLVLFQRRAHSSFILKKQQQRSEHRIRKNKQIKSSVHDGNKKMNKQTMCQQHLVFFKVTLWHLSSSSHYLTTFFVKRV